GEPQIFTEFLNDFIPIDILKGLNPQDIKDITPRHLPLFLDNKDSDTVKQINLGDDADPLYVISIVEHESSVNYTSAYKMLVYTMLVWDTYIKENDKLRKEELEQTGATKRKSSTDADFKLPPVLPIVFYDGATKWKSAMSLIERTYMGDIFEKYIPKFAYELVDLNEYSRKDIIKYGNALSLILLIDKIRHADDFELSASIPQDYVEKLSANIPEPLLPLISECVRVFLKHIEAPEEEINRIADQIYQRRINDMFQMVDGYSVKKTRELVTKELTEKHKEEKIKMVRNLIKMGLSDSQISEATDFTLSEKDIKELRV
ncbi:MAG: Rpn family recombination-promoting nuclease/putative transposase, partial [Oscillospiraceae bacterium]|nr:Rpn family recombination-promoting nuclease/putative transposase [Oscillospiraceae bacterium]